MKAHSETHFEDENIEKWKIINLQLCFLEKGKTTLTKPFTFWKWKHILKKNHILKMKAHSKTHFENENMKKWIHKGSGPNALWLYACWDED